MDKTLLTRGGRGPVGLPEDDVDLVIDGQAVTVRVRGMNRGEMLMLGKLSDDKGKLYIVPTASFSYLEVGTETRSRVGFVA